METIFIVGLILMVLVLWGWALLDLTQSTFKDPTMKTVWLLVVLVFPLVGSIFYFQLKRKLITKESRRFNPNFRHSKL
jgi:hypothetical protein